MRRVAVVGTSGSGKSTVTGALAATLGVPGLELDAAHHLPGWQQRPEAEFRDVVAAFLGEHDGWVVDGNYEGVRDLVLRDADTAVWLDLPRTLVTWRVVRRSAVRVARREELWNGNREQVRNLLSWDPERSIIRWAWTTHRRRRAEYAQVLTDERWRPLAVHRLRTRREVATFLAHVGARA